MEGKSFKFSSSSSSSCVSAMPIKALLLLVLILIPTVISLLLLVWNLQDVQSEIIILRKKLNETESKLMAQNSRIRDYDSNRKKRAAGAVEWSACICPPCATATGYTQKQNRRRKSYSTRSMTFNSQSDITAFLEAQGIPASQVMPLIQMQQSQQQHASISHRPSGGVSASMQQHQQQSASIRLGGGAQPRTLPPATFPPATHSRDDLNLVVQQKSLPSPPISSRCQTGQATTCRPGPSLVINLDDYADSVEDARRRGYRPSSMATAAPKIHDESYFGPVGPRRPIEPPMEFRQVSPEKGEDPGPQYGASPQGYRPPPQEFRAAVQSPEKGDPGAVDPYYESSPQEFRAAVVSPEKGEDPYYDRSPQELRQSPEKGDPYGYDRSPPQAPLEFRQVSPEKGEDLPAPQYIPAPIQYSPPVLEFRQASDDKGDPYGFDRSPQEFRQSPEKGEDPYFDRAPQEFRQSPEKGDPYASRAMEFRQVSDDKGDPYGYDRSPQLQEFRQSPEKGEGPSQPAYAQAPQAYYPPRGPLGPQGARGAPGLPGYPGYSPSKGY